jgi:arginyl-tRNA synthetase
VKSAVRELLSTAVRSWAAAQSPAVTAVDVAVDPAPPNVPGDWASNYPLSVAKAVRKAPRQVAQEILDRLPLGGPIAKAEIAGPGFLNITLSAEGLVAELNRLRAERDNYGRRPEAVGEKVLIEFVSANPNGPLHVGHGRGAALGDSLARLFRHAGYDVTTEYYINNIGNQMENLGASVLWRIDGLDPSYPSAEEKAAYLAKKPEDLYKGAYLIDVARDILRRFPTGAPRGTGIPFFRDEALAYIMAWIRRDLESFGVHHQNWYPESRLYEEARVDAAFQTLRQRGDIKDEDGAVWFLSTKYGDDKDRVLKRQDERPTYFASDIAYHDEKYRRGFHRLIDIWGTDHHGYVARVKAGARALGHDPDRLHILLYQLVTLLRGGKPVAMSTRTGEFVTLSDVVQEVGKDASRFFFALRGPNSHLEFDLDLAKKQASDNPVFYVKYVHARCCSLFREAAKRGGVDPAAAPVAAPASLEPAERDLLVRLAVFPDVIAQCVKDLTPHHITEYLLKLAGGYHRFYESCRVLGSAPAQQQFRLALVDGVRAVIKSGLGLLGVDAPEEM